MKVLILLALLDFTWGACVVCQDLGPTQFCDEPPYNVHVPTCPEDIGQLRLEMFARPDYTNGFPIDPYTIPAIFDRTRRTMFIVHGYTQDFDANWLHNMKDAFIGREDCQVVIVGWGGISGSESANYIESAATTRTVGAYIGQIILNLIFAGGANPALFYITGHSLGAHVCGYAGKWTQTEAGITIGRITGMDPAGPNFSEDGRPPELVGLYPGDAVFVDTILTDHLYGSKPIGLGQINFFPNADNGLIENQPGCATNVCDHLRATDLMLDSISFSNCYPARLYCGSGDLWPGETTDCVPCTDCPSMGYDASPTDAPGVYWMQTNENQPYCQF